jgi:small GTP-binding protein
MIQKKICMVGAFGVGKTSLVARYVRSIFSEKYQTTVGVKIDKKQLVVDDQDVTLMLWDLAGEDALTQVKPAHLRGSAGYLLVVDGTRRNTLETAINLQQRAKNSVGDVPFLLILNKADIKVDWQITDLDLQPLLDRGWTLLEASAKSGDRVEHMFHELASRMLREDDDSKRSAAGAQ